MLGRQIYKNCPLYNNVTVLYDKMLLSLNAKVGGGRGDGGGCKWSQRGGGGGGGVM